MLFQKKIMWNIDHPSVSVRWQVWQLYMSRWISGGLTCGEAVQAVDSRGYPPGIDWLEATPLSHVDGGDLPPRVPPQRSFPPTPSGGRVGKIFVGGLE